MVSLNPTNSRAIRSLSSISLNAKNLCYAFTYPSNLCEFFHLLLSASSVSSGSSLIPLRALSHSLVVLLEAITAVSDSHSFPSGDLSPSKFLLVAFLAVVLVGANLGRSDSLLLSAVLLSPLGPVGARVVLVLSSLCRSDPFSSASYSASFSTESPPSISCSKRG